MSMKPGCRAFTLIELLIVIAIIGIITLAFSQVVVNFHRTSRMALHEQRARSVVQSEKDWIIAGREPVREEEWVALPVDPPLFADIPAATGDYRFSRTDLPDLWRLSLRLTWPESLGPVHLEDDCLVYRPPRKETP